MTHRSSFATGLFVLALMLPVAALAQRGGRIDVPDVPDTSAAADLVGPHREASLRDDEEMPGPPPGVVHVRDELIGLRSLPTGASPSAHMVDPPVPLAAARPAGEQSHHMLERRPVSRSVRSRPSTARATSASTRCIRRSTS